MRTALKNNDFFLKVDAVTCEVLLMIFCSYRGIFWHSD